MNEPLAQLHGSMRKVWPAGGIETRRHRLAGVSLVVARKMTKPAVDGLPPVADDRGEGRARGVVRRRPGGSGSGSNALSRRDIFSFRS
jgi:hypothetical protein